MMATAAMRVGALVAVVGVAPLVAGHGAITFPKSRNAADGALEPWKSWYWKPGMVENGTDANVGSFSESGKNTEASCSIPAKDGVKGSSNASNGQACFWFSNGCTIGCDACDGANNHPGHGSQTFLYKGKTMAELQKANMSVPAWGIGAAAGDMVLDPKSFNNPAANQSTGGKGGLNTTQGLCPNSAKTKATICDPKLRTLNIHAECGSKEDFYYYSPWRAPGTAPVINSCGSAGGRLPGQGPGGAGANYQNNSIAYLGMPGTELPQMEPQATWKAGTAVEVGWAIEAHHGGGYLFQSTFVYAYVSVSVSVSFSLSVSFAYTNVDRSRYSYRLAPAGEPLNEDNFNKMPLHAVGPSILRWDGDKTTQVEFNATRITVGTHPAGSQWTKNPLPGPPMLWAREGPSFEPYCEESQECKDTAHRWTRTVPAPKKKGPEPSQGCAAALAKVCKGQEGKGASCDACALTQWAALEAAGCTEAEEVTYCEATPEPQAWHPQPGVCKCSGSPNVFAWLEPNLEIVDTVMIPADTKPGKYVLNWRWDCEETAQVWQSCSDVEITA